MYVILYNGKVVGHSPYGLAAELHAEGVVLAHEPVAVLEWTPTGKLMIEVGGMTFPAGSGPIGCRYKPVHAKWLRWTGWEVEGVT